MLEENRKKLLIVLAVIVLMIVWVKNPFKGTSVSTKGGTVGIIPSDKDVGADISELAPNFALETLNGEVIRLSDYKGEKAVLINFWATWCPFCLDEMPMIETKVSEVEDEFVVLYINLQETDIKTIGEFAEKAGITPPNYVLLDPTGEIKDAYKVRTQPTSYFVDKNGVIVDKKFGPLIEEELEEKIHKTLEVKVSEKTIRSKMEEEIKVTEDGVRYIVHPSKLVSGGPPKDGIPSIDNPKFISIKEADKFLDDDELVVGINFEGVKRAYPLQIMVYHEVVNDIINGEPLLITYCPLCGTGIAFKRTIDGEAVEFGVSGKLYNSDLVLYDRKTDSYWDQITGRAIIGELVGIRLKKVAVDTVTWGDWKKLYPDTQVLSKDTGFNKPYGRQPYGDYDTSSAIFFPVENKDSRLHPKAIVFGIEISGKFKAYPEEELKKVGTIDDVFAGVNLEIKRDPSGIVTIKDKSTGEKIEKIRGFWFAWVAFHPETELYGEQ